MTVTDCIDKYLRLVNTRPELFAPLDGYPIVTDEAQMKSFCLSSGKKVGVVYESPFNLVVCDLIQGENGLFTYDRVIPASIGKGVVCIPVYNDKFVLIEQQRHPIRGVQLCFPRGCGEEGISAEANAVKELAEEIGATTKQVEYLGEMTADSGVLSAKTSIFLCFVDSFAPNNSEGIIKTELFSKAELLSLISSGKITDGFTLAATSLLLSKTR